MDLQGLPAAEQAETDRLAGAAGLQPFAEGLRGPDGLLADVEGAGGVSPVDAPRDARALEATYADAWFRTITSEVFG